MLVPSSERERTCCIIRNSWAITSSKSSTERRLAMQTTSSRDYDLAMRRRSRKNVFFEV